MLLFLAQALVTFTTLAHDTNSSARTAQNVVARTPAEWAMLWKAHSPSAPAPAVDLTKTIVVAVFVGVRPTAGYDVEITAVKNLGDRTTIEYVEQRPDPGDIVAQVQTSPVHIISVPRSANSIEFRRIER